jgi:hypothetical protein
MASVLRGPRDASASPAAHRFTSPIVATRRFTHLRPKIQDALHVHPDAQLLRRRMLIPLTAKICGEARVPPGTLGGGRVLTGTAVTMPGDHVVIGNLGFRPGAAVSELPTGNVNGSIDDFIAVKR